MLGKPKSLEPAAWTFVAWLFAVIGLTLVYFVTGLIGLEFGVIRPDSIPVWLPAGVGLAALIVLGYRTWPGIFLGSLLISLVASDKAIILFDEISANKISQIPSVLWQFIIVSPLSSLGLAAVYTTGLLVGAYFVNKLAHGRYALDLPTDASKFVLFGILLSTGMIATFAVLVFSFTGNFSWSEFNYLALTWWFRDALGVLILSPLLIAWSDSRRLHLNRREALEFLLLLLGLLLVAYVVFGGVLAPVARNYSLEFLVIPFLIWGAFRFKQLGAGATILVMSVVAIWNTVQGVGPFVGVNVSSSILELQAFVSVTALITVMLAAMISKSRLSEQRFRDLIEHSFEGIALLNNKAEVYYASPSTKQVLGFSPVDLINKEWVTVVNKDDRERVRILLTELVNTKGKTINIETQANKKDGKIIWLECTATNLLDEPSVQAIVVNYRGITDRKQAEQNLKLYNARLAEEKTKDEALIASIGDGIIATDPQGKIIRVNRAFEDMTGLEPEEVVGHTTAEVLRVENDKGQPIPDQERSLHRAFSSGQRVVASHYLVRKDTAKLPVTITATPIIYEGAVIGAIEVLHDITKEKQIDRAKTEFVSLASHQLRGPLAAVNWYGEALLSDTKSSLSDQQKKYLNVIYHSNQRMIHLVNALLNVSRIELGTFMVTPEPTNIIEVAKTVVEGLQPKIKDKKIYFTTNFGKIPIIEADPKLTWTILGTLLENAVKYTPADGEVYFEISTKKLGDSLGGKKIKQDSVVFIFKDTGCGIPRLQQNRIFTKFFRADNAIKTDPDGNGLGLYVVKTLLDNLGGEVWFDSVENKGTTFYLTLPLAGMPKKEGTKRLT